MTDFSARIEAARLLDNLGARLGSLGREFSSGRFTDRHGDGPACLAYEKQAYAMADRLRAPYYRDHAGECGTRCVWGDKRCPVANQGRPGQ